MSFNSEAEMKESVARTVRMATTAEAPKTHRDALQEVMGKGVAASLAIAHGERVDEEGMKCRDALLSDGSGHLPGRVSTEDGAALDHVAAVVKSAVGKK